MKFKGQIQVFRSLFVNIHLKSYLDGLFDHVWDRGTVSGKTGYIHTSWFSSMDTVRRLGGIEGE